MRQIFVLIDAIWRRENNSARFAPSTIAPFGLLGFIAL
jgi:hypothetical protein